MSAFYDLSKTPRNILNQAIVRAIISENNGALFDPSDMSTLYQNAAGTIPVTAVEQPVGKMLDKSGNGYHATQSITAARPTLSARYNQLTNTDSFVGWVHDNVSTTSNYGTDPNGQQTASLLTNKAGSNTFLRAPDGIVASVKTFSCLVKQSSTGWVRLIIANTPGLNAAGCYFNTTTCELGSIARYGTGYRVIGTPKVRAIVDGWVYISITVSGPPEQMQPVFSIAAADGNNVSPVGATCQICWPDLRLGVSEDVYQRVNTATDYDTDERYFKKYLRFDGVDDYLNLPYMGLYAGGACSIVAAMGENKVAYGTTLINETNSTLTAPMYNPTRQSDIGNNWRSLIRNDANVVTLSSTGALINADGHISVRSRIERESNTAAFENSINKESYNYARAGTLTLDKTTIGALLLGGVMGSPNNMNLYGLIITKSALTDSQRIACERYLGRKSGVQL